MWPLTKAYHIQPLNHENSSRLAHRHWFVAKQNPQTQTEFLQAVKWSHIDASMTFDHCKYSDEATDLVKRMKVNLEKKF